MKTTFQKEIKKEKTLNDFEGVFFALVLFHEIAIEKFTQEANTTHENISKDPQDYILAVAIEEFMEKGFKKVARNNKYKRNLQIIKKILAPMMPR